MTDDSCGMGCGMWDVGCGMGCGMWDVRCWMWDVGIMKFEIRGVDLTSS